MPHFLWSLRSILVLKGNRHFSQCSVKCCAKATSSSLAHCLPPRWRPELRHLEILSCHLPGSFPPRIPRFPKPAPQGSRFAPRDSGVHSSGESPPTLSFLQGNPRPPSLSLREGSSRPSNLPEGGNPRPSWRLGGSPAPRSWESWRRSRLPAPVRAAPGGKTR